MCSWERFCAFAREPERRQVGIDTRLSVEGTVDEVDASLAGETVVLWWGLFDQELYIEHDDRRYGPYSPSSGPIPLYRYRKYQKSKAEERADRVAALAERIGLPRAALEGGDLPASAEPPVAAARVPFADPDPFQELTYPDRISAKRAIADELGLPLARLSAEDRVFIDALVGETLSKRVVRARVRQRFKGGAC